MVKTARDSDCACQHAALLVCMCIMHCTASCPSVTIAVFTAAVPLFEGLVLPLLLQVRHAPHSWLLCSVLPHPAPAPSSSQRPPTDCCYRNKCAFGQGQQQIPAEGTTVQPIVWLRLRKHRKLMLSSACSALCLAPRRRRRACALQTSAEQAASAMQRSLRRDLRVCRMVPVLTTSPTRIAHAVWSRCLVSHTHIHRRAT